MQIKKQTFTHYRLVKATARWSINNNIIVTKPKPVSFNVFIFETQYHSLNWAHEHTFGCNFFAEICCGLDDCASDCSFFCVCANDQCLIFNIKSTVAAFIECAQTDNVSTYWLIGDWTRIGLITAHFKMLPEKNIHYRNVAHSKRICAMHTH